MMIPVPVLKPLFITHIHVAEALELGPTPTGKRRIIPITGGSFEGERLHGTILPGGADWQIVTGEGVALLDARYTLQTHDGALIYVNNQGLRYGPSEVMQKLANGEIVDPAQYYFRTTPRFETGAMQYAWLNRVIAIASGMRTKEAVILQFYEVV
jgi:Protein of unknown function (DUF3237)